MLIVYRRCRASEVVDFIDLDNQRLGDIMAHKFKARLVMQVIDVSFSTSKQIVYTQHFVALFDQPVNQVRTQKTGTTCYENSFPAFI
jgi:hypothetical protein